MCPCEVLVTYNEFGKVFGFRFFRIVQDESALAPSEVSVVKPCDPGLFLLGRYFSMDPISCQAYVFVVQFRWVTCDHFLLNCI